MGQLDKGAGVTWGMSGQEIFLNFTATDASPAGLNESVQQVMRVSQDQYDDVEELKSLAVKLESAWQGTAADAAQRGFTPFAIEHENSADALWQASSLMSDQSVAFSSARGGVVPVPPMPDKPPVMTIFTDPAALTTFHEHAIATDAASKHNVSVMHGYESASDHNTTNLPASYGQMTPDSTDVVVEQTPPSGGTVHSGHGATPKVSPRISKQQDVANSTTAKAPATSSLPPAGSPDLGGVLAPAESQPPVSTGHDQAPSVRAPKGPDQSGARRDGGGTVAPLPGSAGLDEHRGAGTGSARSGSAQRGSGRLSSGAPVTGRPGGGQAEPVDGARRTGGTASMAEGVATHGEARAGVAGGVPMGAGNRRAESEDRERERSGFLRESAAEELFGTDEVTAPSVIE